MTKMHFLSKHPHNLPIDIHNFTKNRMQIRIFWVIRTKNRKKIMKKNEDAFHLAEYRLMTFSTSIIMMMKSKIRTFLICKKINPRTSFDIVANKEKYVVKKIQKIYFLKKEAPTLKVNEKAKF